MTQLPPPSRNAYLTMIRTAWAFAGDERPRMRRFYGMFLCANLILLAQPWALGEAINALQAGGPDLAMEAAKWLGFNGLLMLGFWAFHGPARVVEMIFGFHNRRRFITALYRRVTDLPMAWHAEHHSGDTINRIRKAAEAVQAFSGEQFFYFETVIRFVGPIIVLSVIAWPLAIICLVLSVLIFWLLNRFDKVLIPLVHVENETDHAVTAGMFDYISNIATVLTLRLQEPTRVEMARRLMAAAGIIPRRAVLNEIKWFSMWMLVMLLEFLVLMAYILMMIHSGKVELGTLVAVLTYVRGLNEVFMRFAYAYADLVRQAAAVDSVRPILAAEPRVGADMPSLADWRRIEIADLSFSYEDEHHHRHSVAGIALALSRGERIALVGGSGGGKSTLAKLLRGLYQTAPGQGHATVDGVRFPDLGPLDPLTTLAPQDPELFENTIRFNITLGADATPEQLARACDIAGFTPVLAELPKGLDTDIREKGVNLSGGQQQRLALARAVFAAAGSSLLLLDEPTSSLDPATEARVLTNLFTAFPDHAIVMALHRLHLLPRFDRVIVLEKGRIVEEGRFDALIAKGGALAAMWASYGEAMDEA